METSRRSRLAEDKEFVSEEITNNMKFLAIAMANYAALILRTSCWYSASDSAGRRTHRV